MKKQDNITLKFHDSLITEPKNTEMDEMPDKEF